MLQAFVIVLREGFESFLIVAIIAAYLRKTGQRALMPAVGWGIALSVVASAALGFALQLGANEPLWEGITGVISAVLVAAFVVHMWKTAPHLKQDVETELKAKSSGPGAYWAVFFFTLFMVAREGMETALLLIQVHSGEVVAGALLGTLAAAGIALLWMKLGHLINLKLFFQVTSLFLMLFVLQILLYSFHEFSEAGLLPNSEALHVATEPFSPDGLYGKWISLATVMICVGWLIFVGIKQALLKKAASK